MITADRQGVTDLLERLDRAFRGDDGSAMADQSAPDARLQWPGIEDIVGREEIGAALVDLMRAYHTVSWEPSYQVFDVHDDRGAWCVTHLLTSRYGDEQGEPPHGE